MNILYFSKFVLAFVLILLFSLCGHCLAQGRHGATSSTSAGSSAQSSTTSSAAATATPASSVAATPTNSINYYYIGDKVHLKYHSISKKADTVWQTIPTTESYTITVYTTVLRRKVNLRSTVKSGFTTMSVFGKQSLKIFEAIRSLPTVGVTDIDTPHFVADSTKIQCIKVVTVPCPCDQRVPLAIIDTIKVDNIERYYGVGGPFKATITPADSGKLQVVPIIPNKKIVLLGQGTVNIVRYVPSGILIPAIPMSKSDSSHNFYMQIDYNSYLKDELQSIKKVFFSLQGGAITIPYKYRFGNKALINATNSTTGAKETVFTPSESTLNFNIAGYIGEKFGLSSFFYNSANNYNSTIMFTEFVGINPISLGATNVSSSTDLGSVPSSAFAITYGTSMSVEFKSFNVGLFLGKDHMIPQHTGWVYNDKFWVGIGFGFNLTGLFANNFTSIQH